MKNPELVILAAGMGSRYGGLKQIDSLDDYGHIIIDYSIHDAIKAGFHDVTFIIKKEIEADFREVMDKHLEGKDVNVKSVFFRKLCGILGYIVAKYTEYFYFGVSFYNITGKARAVRVITA